MVLPLLHPSMSTIYEGLALTWSGANPHALLPVTVKEVVLHKECRDIGIFQGSKFCGTATDRSVGSDDSPTFLSDVRKPVYVRSVNRKVTFEMPRIDIQGF